jgi:DNA-binding protein HU-beta
MTKKQLAISVSLKTGTSVVQSEKFVDATINAIANELKSGGQISLRKFGVFSVSNRKAKKVRNFRTKQIINLPARKLPIFTASTELKSLCQ